MRPTLPMSSLPKGREGGPHGEEVGCKRRLAGGGRHQGKQAIGKSSLSTASKRGGRDDE